MTASIVITTEPAAVQIQPGGRASVRIVLANKGDLVGQYVLSVSGPDPAWLKLDSAQVGVFPADKAAVQLAIRLPEDAISATYRVVVMAQNQLDGADQAQAVLELTVHRPEAQPDLHPPAAARQAQTPAPQATVVRARPLPSAEAAHPAPDSASAAFGEAVLKASSPNGQVRLLVDREGLRVQPGASQALHIGLSNTGGVAVVMAVQVRGAPLSWLSLNPPSLTLAPGDTGYATLTAGIPAQAPLGSYPLTLAAQAGEDASLAVRVNLMLDVTQAGEIRLELLPPQAEGEGSAEFSVQVSQSGAAPQAVSLSAQDERGLLDFSFTPAALTIAVEGKSAARLSVRPRQSAATEPLTIPFQVTAASTGGGAAATVQGRFLHLKAAPVRLLLQTDEVRAPAGAAFQVRMVNPAQSAVAYRLSASDASGGCQVQFDTPQLNLAAHGEAVTTLRVTPLAYLAGGEMIYTVRVMAFPVTGRAEPLSGEVRYIQSAGQMPGLAISPASQTSPGPAAYWVQVSNPRPVPLQIELRPYDPSQQCQFAIDPPVLVVPAQGQAAARLDVQPLAALLAGETRRVCSFGVAGYFDNQPNPILAEGALLLVNGLTWRKLLPFLAVVVVLLGLGGAAALVLLYLQYFR